nr:hypothetical protein [Vespula vulgaris luteo-like virus 1]
MSVVAGLREGLRNDITAHEMHMILDLMEENFSPVISEIPADFLTREHFYRVLSEVEMSSSPGYPYMRRAPTNKILFGFDGEVYDQSKAELIWFTVQERIRIILCGELDSPMASDPIRLFIKPEPIKLEKAREGRYRLISSVSVVDQIIDLMLFNDQNQSLYKHFWKTPSRVGWSPYNGGWKFLDQFERISLDKKAWDWTAQPWLFHVVFQFRARHVTDWRWLQLAAARYKILLQPTFVTSGGVLLKQKAPGVMKSGCVNTIADNTMMQAILHYRCCLLSNQPLGTIDVMGDDTVQDRLLDEQSYLYYLKQFCLVKEVSRSVEFAGMLFKGPNVIPLYKGKHAFNLLHVDEDVLPDMAVSYSLLYHRSPYIDWFEALFKAMDIEIPSRSFRDRVFDGMT